jgi:hypothetical protein
MRKSSLHMYDDAMAEWSKAPDLGSGLNWHGFKSHWHHLFFGIFCLWSMVVSLISTCTGTRTGTTKKFKNGHGHNHKVGMWSI